MLQTLLPDLDMLLRSHLPDAGLRPPADARSVTALGKEAPGGRLPDELRSWFAWHDGQDADAPALIPQDAAPSLTFLNQTGRALSAAEALKQIRLRRGTDGWQTGWLPLFVIEADDGDEDTLVVYDCTAGSPGVLRYAWSTSAAEGILRSSLAGWVDHIVTVLRSVYGPFDPTTLAQRRVLATTADAAVLWGKSWYEVLGHLPRPRYTRTAYSILSRHYDAVDRADVARVLDELRKEGARGKLAEATGEPVDTFALFDELRRAHVAGYAYAAYLLDEVEAWSLLCETARNLQRRYDSWEALSRAYRHALAVWIEHVAGPEGLLEEEGESEQILEGYDDAVETLRSAGWSPWRLVPWNTPIPAELPAPPALRQRLRKASSVEQLEALLDDIETGDVIELEAGTYRGAFTAGNAGVELRACAGAEGKVILESDGSGATLRGEGGLAVRGLVLRNASGQPGQDGDAVNVRESVIHLDGCDVQGTTFGIRALGSWAHVSMVAGRVHDCGDTGVMVFTGDAVLDRVEIDGCGGNAVQLGDKGRSARLSGCRLHDGRASALALFARGEATLRGCHIAGHPRPQIGAIAGCLEVDGCRIERGGHDGIYAQGEHVRVSVVRCELRDHGASHLEVQDKAHLLATECLMERSGADAVSIHHGASAHLVDCSVEHAAYAAIAAQADAWVTLVRPRIAKSGRGLVSGSGASLAALDVTVREPSSADESFRPLALLVGEDAWLAAAGAILEAAIGESAIQCIGQGQLALERTRIEGGHGALIAGGSAYLASCALVGSETAALEVKGDSLVIADRCTVERSRYAAIECHHGAVVELRDCELSGGQSALFAHDGGKILSRGGSAAGGDVAVETRNAYARVAQTKLWRGAAGLTEVSGGGTVEIDYEPAAGPIGIRLTAQRAEVRLTASDFAHELDGFGIEPVPLLEALVRWLLDGRLAPVAEAIEVEVDELGVTLASAGPEPLRLAAEAVAHALADQAPLVLAQLRAVARTLSPG